MKNLYKLSILFSLLMASVNLWALEFPAVNSNNDTIYYMVTSNTAPLTVAVVHKPQFSINNGYSGTIEIPASVTYQNKRYSVTSIGSIAFMNCMNLTSVTIPITVTSIQDGAFQSCSSLQSIVIPNSVTFIGMAAFDGCVELTSANIPENVTTIREAAFRNCRSLDSINIHNSIISIGNYAFQGCNSLTSIIIPNSVTSIGKYAFANCRGLSTFRFPNSVSIISDGTFFDCVNLSSVVIPESITSIGNCAFQKCYKLLSIDIPDSVTTIGDEAFSYCLNLNNIEISNSLTSIGNKTFLYCSRLTNVNIPNSVTSIGELAFWDCENLASITIPNSVTSIGNWAFTKCKSLNAIHCLAITPPIIADSTFYQPTTNIPLIVRCGCSTAYDTAQYWSNFTNIIEEDNCYAIVKVTADDRNHGNVSGNGFFNVNSEVIIFAIANSGFRFNKWDDGNTENPRTITVTQDTSFVAIFGISHELDELEAAEVNFYPNPANGVVHLQMDDLHSNVEISIFDLSGRLLQNTTTQADGRVFDLNISSLAEGIYFIKICSSNSQTTKKLVVK